MIAGKDMLAEAIRAGVIAGSYSLAAREEPRLAEDLERRALDWHARAGTGLGAWVEMLEHPARA